MSKIAALYADVFGRPPQRIELLAGAGSNRRYSRLYHHDGSTVIGVENDHVAENRAFLYLAEHFAAKHLPVPHIYAYDEEECAYLQSDLGDLSLYEALSDGRQSNGNFSTTELQLLERSIRLLPQVQIKGAEDLNEQWLLSPTRFDRRSVMFDLNYFKYCFLRLTDTPYDECRLEDDFEQLTTLLCQIAQRNMGFMYRDFQARNLMIYDGQPWLIDFQGGRFGPLHYDLASFLGQASAAYSQLLRQNLTEIYLDSLADLRPIDREAFREELRFFFLFRTLQVLGAYGLRGLYERKSYFRNSIPQALEQVKTLLPLVSNLSELHNTLERITLLQL